MTEIYILEDSQQSIVGGGQKVSAVLIEYLLSQSDVKVTIVDTLKRNESFFQRFPGVSFCNYRRPKLRATGTEPSFTYSPISSLLLVAAASLAGIKLARLIFSRSNLKPPILYCPTKFGYFAALLPRLMFSCKLIMHVHNVAERNFASRLFQWLLRITSEEVVCVSQTVFESINHPRKALIRNPILGLPEIKRSLRTDGLSLGVVASFFPYKGHSFFLQEVAKLVTKHPQVDVHLYGDGPELAWLSKRYMCKSIHFHGRLKDLDAIYAKLDVVVIPSLKPEAFSIVIPEAWSYGCLVLASDVPAHKELIEDGVNGCLFATGDSKDLLKKLEGFIQDWPAQKYRIAGGHTSLSQLITADFAPQLSQIILR
jgi:glycosyltransferase involved in cell wall biosynthesis